MELTPRTVPVATAGVPTGRSMVTCTVRPSENTPLAATRILYQPWGRSPAIVGMITVMEESVLSQLVLGPPYSE